MEKILITGVSGFLGQYVAQALKSRYRVCGTYLDHPVSNTQIESFAFDLTQVEKIEKFLEALRPGAIVHTAAYSDPEFCENHHKDAVTLNTLATKEISRAAGRLGAKLIYISTDLVFDGAKGFYTEADGPAPGTFYGKTKYLGELEVTNHNSHYAILRLSVMYGRGGGHKQNLFETIEEDTRAGRSVRLFTDQYRTPLFVGDAVTVIDRLLTEESLKGLFHLGGPERLSRYEFGEIFCRIFRRSPDFLIKASLSDHKFLALRPKDCSLRSDKIIRAANISPTPPHVGLRCLLELSQ